MSTNECLDLWKNALNETGGPGTPLSQLLLRLARGCGEVDAGGGGGGGGTAGQAVPLGVQSSGASPTSVAPFSGTATVAATSTGNNSTQPAKYVAQATFSGILSGPAGTLKATLTSFINGSPAASAVSSIAGNGGAPGTALNGAIELPAETAPAGATVSAQLVIVLEAGQTFEVPAGVGHVTVNVKGAV